MNIKYKGQRNKPPLRNPLCAHRAVIATLITTQQVSKTKGAAMLGFMKGKKNLELRGLLHDPGAKSS